MFEKFKVKSGEMVVPKSVADNITFSNALMDMLDELETSEVEIDEQELERRINELAVAFTKQDGVNKTVADAIHRKLELMNKRAKSSRPTRCTNCGAPLHGEKCDYCGTEY